MRLCYYLNITWFFCQHYQHLIHWNWINYHITIGAFALWINLCQHDNRPKRVDKTTVFLFKHAKLKDLKRQIPWFSYDLKKFWYNVWIRQRKGIETNKCISRMPKFVSQSKQLQLLFEDKWAIVNSELSMQCSLLAIYLPCIHHIFLTFSKLGPESCNLEWIRVSLSMV